MQTQRRESSAAHHLNRFAESGQDDRILATSWNE